MPGYSKYHPGNTSNLTAQWYVWSLYSSIINTYNADSVTGTSSSDSMNKQHGEISIGAWNYENSMGGGGRINYWRYTPHNESTRWPSSAPTGSGMPYSDDGLTVGDSDPKCLPPVPSASYPLLNTVVSSTTATVDRVIQYDPSWNVLGNFSDQDASGISSIVWQDLANGVADNSNGVNKYGALRMTYPSVAFLSATPGTGNVLLSWAPQGGSPVSDYEYSTDGGASWISTNSTFTSYTVNGLTSGTPYTFKVKAISPGRSSTPSASVTATPN